MPQGSILGPLLFLIYVNDMPQAVKSNLLLYADDSCLMYQHRDVNEIEKQLNNNFENFCSWFVGCVLDETLCGEPMAFKALNKINEKVKFLYHKNKFLTPTLRRMLCNVIIQSHFDYACSAGYPNLNEKLEKKIHKIAQNKCIWFFLKQDKRPYIQQRV